VFDMSGKFVRNIGRDGAGPGEFRQIERFGWVGDTLWVSDPVLRRYTLFDRSFKPWPSFAWDVQGQSGSHAVDLLTPRGRVPGSR